jgi:hypothetical protein
MEINIKTKKCVHCREDINVECSRCPKCGGKNYVWTTGRKILLIVIIIMFLPMFLSLISSSTSTTESQPVPQKTQKEIDEWNKSSAGKLCAKHTDWKEDECKDLIKRLIWVGMKYDMLVYLYGKPNHINPSNYGGGNRYQYCWDDITPSCYYDNNDDDIIDSYN